MFTELETALAHDPSNLATLINLGKLYINAGRTDEALPLLQRAVDHHPDVFLAQNYLGDAYYLTLQPDKAIAHYQAALHLRPDDVDVITNLSVCHWQIGDIATAYRHGATVRDHQPVNFGLLSLLTGDYATGWRYWEHLNTARSIDAVPCWTGDVTGHLLVVDEDQGYGDSIMLARYLPLLAARCETLTFLTRSPLTRLMQHSFPMISVIDDLDAKQYDRQVRLFSLPRLLGTRLNTIPDQPYLGADPTICAAWSARMPAGVKIGLRWAGSADNPMDRIRSIGDLTVLAPLWEVPGVTWVSLAKEPSDLPLLDVSDGLTDFAATAGLLCTLDLVISIDTGVLNLAGALGVPAWLLNYHGSDWRWGISGERSPWYPSVRIFRQPKLGDWRSVIDAVTQAIIDDQTL
jgi:hypothetical protein